MMCSYPLLVACKGWGVVAREHVPAGAYVCNYAGEYVSSTEAARRLDLYDKQGAGHALLVRQGVCRPKTRTTCSPLTRIQGC